MAWRYKGVMQVRSNTSQKATEKFISSRKQLPNKQHYKPLLGDLLLKVNYIVLIKY